MESRPPRETAPPRVMVDANVLIAAARLPRWPWLVLLHAVVGDYKLVLCPYIVEEATRHVARYPDYRARFERLLEQLDYELVPDPSPAAVAANLTLVRSAKDVPIALAAIQAGVSYFVSSDADFTDEGATAPQFRRAVQPMLPAVFLRQVMGHSSAELEAIRYRTWKDLPDLPLPAS